MNDTHTNFKLIVVGHTSGKMSQHMLRQLIARDNVTHYSNFENFRNSFDDNVKQRKCPLFILPIYCEDVDLVRPFNVSLATSIEDLVFKQSDNITVLHPSRIGNVIGNKAETNRFLTSNGILCPKMLTGNQSTTTAFVNDICGSGVCPMIVKGLLDPHKYSTEFIDTTYVYGTKEYWTVIRTMCVGTAINETYVYLREKNLTVDHLNASVHAYDSPKCSNIHNAYYNDVVRLALPEIQQTCFKLGKILGTGFYSHDILIGCDGRAYVSECGFKADSPTWKKYSKEFAHELSYEYSYDVSIERSIDLLMEQLTSK